MTKFNRFFLTFGLLMSIGLVGCSEKNDDATTGGVPATINGSKF